MPEATHFPKKIRVRLLHPAPEGLAVRLSFGMTVKNAYHYITFVDSNGLAQVTGEELLVNFRAQLEMALMDYVDPEKGFSGGISAKLLTPEGLKQTLDAFKMFQGSLRFPEGYEKRLQTALGRGQQPANCVIDVQIEH